MTHEIEQIFSSTGNLGVSRRQDNRLYVNGTYYADNQNEVLANFGRLTTIAAKFPGKISRSVYRGAVSRGVLDAVRETKLVNNLEVALPLEEFTGDNSWLVYLAKNHAGRRPLVSINQMIEETNRQNEVVKTPLQRVGSVLDEGYHFSDNFDQEHDDQIYELWSKTFGWKHDQIESLRKRLERVKGIPAQDRDVWFSAIVDNGTIVSAAMAERLTIPANSRSLDLIESTEWRTSIEYVDKHLMTANLVMLNSQILSDLRFSQSGTPLIFAECNFKSRSDRAGHGAGFIIPDRSYAQQLIVQNVHVGDGADLPQGSLRDFSFMYLPMSEIASGYNHFQVDIILQHKNAG